ncbi:MAG TPA: GNAT family N-acetyltransferase [Polyangiaceae bacterium]|nr:GNAT family N-acetyltransferase [Polyangiaceae bacterium]
MTTSIRPAREDDLGRLIEIHGSAYPGSGTYDHQKRDFTHHPLGGLDDVRVIEKDGRIVGHAVLFTFDLWIGGRRVPSAGLASVAIASEARGQGLGRVLLDGLHEEMASRSVAQSLLYPFREGYYARLGYATTAPLVTLRLAASAVVKAAARKADPSDEPLEPVTIEGARVAEARALYERVARGTSGRLARSEEMWMRLFAEESRYMIGVASPQHLEGYVRFFHDVPELHGRQTLVVRDFVPAGPRARRALFELLGRQRDQVDDIELTVPYGDAHAFAFEDAPGARRGSRLVEHPIGYVGAGPMVRLVDVARALASRGYLADGELVLRHTGERGAQTLRIVARDGVAEVAETHDEPQIEVTTAALASIAACGIRPSEAAELGWVQGNSNTVAQAERLFSGPRFQCLDPF